jgi:hypothetical protein
MMPFTSNKALFGVVYVSALAGIVLGINPGDSCDCKVKTFDCSADNKIYHCDGNTDGHYSEPAYKACDAGTTCKTYVWEYGRYYTPPEGKYQHQGASCVPNNSGFDAPAETCDPNVT